MPKTYGNPRVEAAIKNWPSGSIRVTALFKIETNKRGQRATRVTEDPQRGTVGHKVLTFARKARIVDGSDGRTYLAMLTEYGHVSIMRGDMKIQEESIFDSDPRFAAVRALFGES